MLKNLLSLLALAGLGLALVAAPVPTEKKKDEKDDKPFEFPDLESKKWKKLDSGLKVWDVTEGKGDEVKAGAKVKVNYTGWLTDGTKFDSSFDRKEPIEFGLNGVIKGWTEGVPGMKPGGIRRLVIPSELAYGDRKVGDVIKPNSTLVFVIELIEIK